jgi:hypothetical protein
MSPSSMDHILVVRAAHLALGYYHKEMDGGARSLEPR